MYLASGWKDYEVLDAGGGEKLERWGDVVLRRPDPQAIWAVRRRRKCGTRPDAALPPLRRRAAANGNLGASCRSAGRFPMAGTRSMCGPRALSTRACFPKQAVNWDWMAERIRAGQGRSARFEFVWLHGRGDAGLRARGRESHACGRGQGHGAVGGREPPASANWTARARAGIVDDALKFVAARTAARQPL